MNVRLLSIAALLIAGCGGSGSSVVTAPVSGKVTMNGAPLEGALVNYSIEGYVSTGLTKADGSYSLPSGAGLGENNVWITKFVAPEGYSNNPEDGMDQGQLEASNMDAANTGKKVDTGEKVPAEFSNPEMTTLKMVVPDSGTSTANFAI